MKRILTILLLSVLALGMSAQGDYTSLWKQCENAQKKDQPKTALSAVRKIEAKAEKEKHYGHLFAALFTEKNLLGEISRDSIAPMEKRMEAKYQELSKIAPVGACLYRVATIKNKKGIVDSLLYHTSPEIVNELTKENGTLKYIPFIEKGADSKYFNHDLISLIAYSLNDYEPLVRFYSEKGNRKAACIAASLMLKNLNTSSSDNEANLKKADSLIAIYGDLNECGAIALRKLHFFSGKNEEVAKKKIEWIDEAMKRWPKWQEIDALKNERNNLTQPTVNIRIPNSAINTSQKPKVFFENARNISRAEVSIIPVSGLTYEVISDLNLEGESDLIKKQSKYLQKDKAITLSKDFGKHEEYEYFEDSLSFGNLPLGTYFIDIKFNNVNISQYNRNSNHILIVSDLKVITLQQSKQQTRFVVVDAISGTPVAGAKLHLIDRNKNEKHKVKTTDEKGEYLYEYPIKDAPYNVFATTDKDKAMHAQYFSTWFNETSKKQSIEKQNEIFTDRAIYRPGQTVHVSILAYYLRNSETTKIAQNEELNVTITDATDKEIASAKVKTDDFGVAKTDFVLPEQTKNGTFWIRTDNLYSTSFRVEEYVRPTFEVTINKPEIEYKDGNTITVTGIAKTYSGVPVSNAKVAYTIRRNNTWWWRTTDYQNTLLLKDTIQTDASGKFTMKMPMFLPEEYRDKSINPLRYYCPAFYSIKATAVVTDIAGESHEAQLSLPLSNRSTVLTSNIEDKYLKSDKPIEITFTRRNNAGTEIDGEVSIEIDGKEQGKAVCGKAYVIPMQIPTKSHFIRAICGTDTIEKKFVLFSLEDKAPATETKDWWYATGDKFPATIQFGTCEKDVHAVYTIFSGSKVIESGSLKLDSSLVTRKFEYKEEYGDGICYTVAWVRNGKFYSHSHTITRPLPDNTLKLNWTTFRNKLEPGQKEEWKLSVTDKEGKPANANVMAVLYDKSLDAIKTHSWNFRDSRHISNPSYHWEFTNYYAGIYLDYTKTRKWAEVKSLRFSHFDYSYFASFEAKVFDLAPGTNNISQNTRVRIMGTAPMATECAGVLMAKGTNNAKVHYRLQGPLDESEENEAQEEVPIRTNLNETAFFMPQLRTDDKGIATLSFTLPESVTTWKFMAFAHDKDVRFGTITDEIIAQKKLMIQPRLPRFLREGDVTDIPASVSNITDKDITATVKFTILDAKTEKVLATQSKKITVKAGESEAVSFPYDSRNQEDKSIIVRYSVSGKSEEGTFTDGEQKDLPILSQKELMVNTQTFILTEAGEKTFDLKKIMPSVNDKHLTVEYTDSPEWLMIKALPYISKYYDECVICLSSAYYANSIATGIARTNPEIRKAVDEWKSDELKQLFDSTSIEYRNTDILSRLSNLQNSDGSWSWWKGMNGSTYMTVQVLKTLVRLNLMMNDEKFKKQNEQLIKRSFNFLDKEIEKRVAEMKKEKFKYLPYYALDYLYCRAIAKASGTNVKSNSNADYLLKLVPEETRYDDMRTKAQAAIVLSFMGNKSKASEFIKSIVEHTVYREDLGRYFDSDRALYSWCDYKIPTQVSVIEALKLIDGKNSAKEIADMKRWLLQSKRTQSWDTPINAVDAIYAFLCPSQGTTSSLRKGIPADIALGKTRMPAQEYTSALGYVKTSKDITSKDNTLTVTKHTDGESWANVFIEYKQTAIESKEFSTGLSITRKVESPNKQLKVGDKVEVIITITADRDYDFVTVTDNRPACLEPVEQLSGYSHGTYKIIRDTKTEYCYNMMRKGTHVIKTSYFVARSGNYTSGTATATCTYSPVFTGRTPGSNYVVK